MPKHILVVEDTVVLRENIVELLQMEEFFVTSAGNGKEAIAFLEKTKVDLIITDLLMPEMKGVDLIARIRENPRWKETPILVFSAMPAQENEETILRMGADSYLKKPSTLDALLKMVEKLLQD